VNVAFTRAAEGFPRRAFTVEDIRRMIDAGVISEDEKFELIEGEIVMAAAKGIAHERIKPALLPRRARILGDRRQHGHRLDSHRAVRRRLVLHRRARPAGRAVDSRAAGLAIRIGEIL
jgi:hypothetical protein